MCIVVLCRICPQWENLRRIWTATVELCYLAAGSAELYVEIRLFPWDWSAAAVVVREAGGVVGTVPDERLRHDSPVVLLAANSEENFRILQERVASVIPVRPYKA